MAMLASMSAALHFLPAPPGSAIFSLGGFPLVLSGFLLGPGGGFWCGAVADVLSYVVHPMGMFFPGYTLTSALTAALPIALYRAGTPHDQPLPLSAGRLVCAILISQELTKLLVALFTSKLFGLPFQALAAKSALEQLLHAPLYAYGVFLVLRRLIRIRNFRIGAYQWRDESAGPSNHA